MFVPFQVAWDDLSEAFPADSALSVSPSAWASSPLIAVRAFDSYSVAFEFTSRFPGETVTSFKSSDYEFVIFGSSIVPGLLRWLIILLRCSRWFKGMLL